MRTKQLDFGGARVSFVQIGLGTNCTFVQHLVGEEADRVIPWLLEAASEHHPLRIRGVAVEPVAELVEDLRARANLLPFVELVQAAIGEHDEVDADLQVFGRRAMNELLNQVAPASVDKAKSELEYLLNMSCVGNIHPMVPKLSRSLLKKYGINVESARQATDVWSWEKLATQCNFVSCELLIIDTEGYDARILRSLMQHCRERPEAWPWLIQFETMGHCDHLDGEGTEWAVIHELEMEGYTLVSQSHYNSHLVRSEEIGHSRPLTRWVDSWRCTHCGRQRCFPYVSMKAEGIICRRCCWEGKHAANADTWAGGCSTGVWKTWPEECGKKRRKSSCKGDDRADSNTGWVDADTHASWSQAERRESYGSGGGGGRGPAETEWTSSSWRECSPEKWRANGREADRCWDRT